MSFSKFKPKSECCANCTYDCTDHTAASYLADVNVPVLNSTYFWPGDLFGNGQAVSTDWSNWLNYAEGSSFSVVVKPCIFNDCSVNCDPTHTLWSAMIRVNTVWYIDEDYHVCLQWRTRFTATWSPDNSNCACELGMNMFNCAQYTWNGCCGCTFCVNGVTEHCAWGNWNLDAIPTPSVTTLGGIYGYLMPFRVAEAACGCGKCCDRTCTLSNFQSSFRCNGISPGDPCHGDCPQ